MSARGVAVPSPNPSRPLNVACAPSQVGTAGLVQLRPGLRGRAHLLATRRRLNRAPATTKGAAS